MGCGGRLDKVDKAGRRNEKAQRVNHAQSQRREKARRKKKRHRKPMPRQKTVIATVREVK
jgi:hypothetical protein